MEKSDDDSGNGRIVLATVKESSTSASSRPSPPSSNWPRKSADVVGMSGLLVKSTVVMKETLQELNTLGVAERLRCCSAARGSPVATSRTIYAFVLHHREAKYFNT